MAKPIVSVVMATCNDVNYIEKAINSVVNQNFQDWEFIIVNDASTDGSLELISQLAEKDSRICLINLEANIGQAPALNLGLNRTQGKYIARIDGDDYWCDTNKLTDQVNFLEQNQDHALVGTCGIAIDSSDKELFKLEFPQTDSEIRRQILFRNCFIHCSVMYRSDIAKQLGWYKNTEGVAEDYELWLEMGKNHKFSVLPSVSVCYRINPTGRTQTKSVTQWQAAINLSTRNKNYYPNFYQARIKLEAQKFFLMVFGPEFLTKFKKIIFK